MTEIFTAMKDLAAMAGYIITIITLIGLICKPIRESIINKLTQSNQNKEILEAIQELKEQMREVKQSLSVLEKQQQNDSEATKCSLRNTITHLYYKYTRIGEIPPLERENVSMLCKAYFALKGNSYVQACYEELMDLPTTN